MDKPNGSFPVVALDLRMALGSHIMRGRPSLLLLLTVCLKHPHETVR